MSELLARVKTSPNICGIELAFSGSMTPSVIEGYQVFNNSMNNDVEFSPTYFGRATVNFNEESATAAPGVYYKQKLSITFSTSDASRAVRLEQMHKVKYAKILLSNGLHLVIGRNDFEQNSRIKVSVKTDERLGQVEFSSLSIFSCGYTPRFEGGLPVLFPINFTID